MMESLKKLLIKIFGKKRSNKKKGLKYNKKKPNKDEI
jgi:hypothetical protein